MYSHDLKNNLGLCGIKGVLYAKEIIEQSDLIISFGCRLAPSLTNGNPETFTKNTKVISINNDVNELDNPLLKINKKLNVDLKNFFKTLENLDHKLSFKKLNGLTNVLKLKRIKRSQIFF